MPEVRYSMFDEFLNNRVKIPFWDGSILKVGRGTLVDFDENFLKIDDGTDPFVIGTRSVIKVGLDKHEKG